MVFEKHPKKSKMNHTNAKLPKKAQTKEILMGEAMQLAITLKTIYKQSVEDTKLHSQGSG